jgi:hypothetical protein
MRRRIKRAIRDVSLENPRVQERGLHERPLPYPAVVSISIKTKELGDGVLASV